MQFNFFLFIFDSPVQIALVVGVIVLLFGSSKLPQLARSLGESRKAFKDAMRQAEEEESAEKAGLAASPAAAQINQVSDEALMEEMRRRVEAKQVSS